MNPFELACILASYEVDAPHFDEAEQERLYPTFTVEKIKKMLNSKHCGDCIDLPASCPRCNAEEWLYKAKFILEKMNAQFN